MGRFQQIRAVLEILYFLSSVALAVIGAYGLKQIKLLKRDMHTRNDRAAKEKAIEASNRFITSVDLNHKYHEALKNAGLKPYTGPIGDFTSSSLAPAWRENANKKVPLSPLWMPILNEYEGMASAYMSGVADEELGYKILGLGFCRSVQRNYDVISLQRGSGKSEWNFWKNTIGLYTLWSNRIKQEGLLEKLTEVSSQLRGSSNAKITPLGIEDDEK
jgi:hypothetical protein